MNQSLFKRPFFWYGIYYGVASILIFSLIYALNFEFFGRFFWWMGIGVMALVAFMIMGGMAERKANGGYLTYFDGFKYLFLIGIIGYIVNLLFTIVFVNFIDPGFNENLRIVIKESTMEMMQKWEVPDEKIDLEMDKMDAQFTNANTAWYYLKQFFSSAVMSMIFALICALFVKRNRPDNMPDFKPLDQIS